MMKKNLTGFRAWLVQRLSAVYMLCFIVFLSGHFLLDRPRSYFNWHSWVASPAISMAIAVFFGALLVHAWVGLRDVVLDYVRPSGIRAATLVTLVVVLATLGLWVTRILWLGRA